MNKLSRGQESSLRVRGALECSTRAQEFEVCSPDYSSCSVVALAAPNSGSSGYSSVAVVVAAAAVAADAESAPCEIVVVRTYFVVGTFARDAVVLDHSGL